jgi:hypothetical protein
MVILFGNYKEAIPILSHSLSLWERVGVRVDGALREFIDLFPTYFPHPTLSRRERVLNLMTLTPLAE